MHFKDFQELSDKEKADRLWDKGQPVGSFQMSDARYILYQLDEFYVQVEYKTDFMEIVSLKAYEASGLPEIYLKQVNISGLNH